ncbi:MAG: polysaccharide biosynthesis/export family protein [Candidatus Eisenbacteria bacterium]|nr:polysaccharide biosynthesis/export family protein [Candidatus Eisenbacteria bacterium]
MNAHDQFIKTPAKKRTSLPKLAGAVACWVAVAALASTPSFFPALTQFPGGALGLLSVVLGPATCGAADETDYQIGVEDVVSVAVRERPDLSGSFTVGPDGALALPLVGEVKAAGLTVSQFSRELNRKLSVFHAGEATVSVAQYNSRKVFVVGEVAKPGKYSFSVIPSIWHVLSEAGGPTDAALLSGVQVIRAASGETMTVDIRKLLDGEAPDQVKLQPGDTVRVPRRASATPGGSVVYVLGQVSSQGGYEPGIARDVVSALAAAGGITERAEVRKIMLVRRGSSVSTPMRVNLEKYLKEGLAVGNPETRPGDTIMVPAKRTWLSTFFSPGVLVTLASAAASVALIVSSD